MKIVIDARMLSWTGIGRYTSHLLEHLPQLDTSNDYVVVMLEADRALWSPTADNFKCQFVTALPYSLHEQTELPRVLRKLKPDLVHFTHFTVPLLYNGPYVVTVHDLTLVDFKNIRGEGLGRWSYEVKYLASRLVLRHAVKSSRLVITPTHYVKDRLAGLFHLAPERLTTTMLGVDPLGLRPETGQPETPFIFSVGNSYPYKNLDALVDAFAASAFCKQGGRLVFAGPDDYFRTAMRARVTKLGLDGPVKFVGRVSDQDLANLYAAATAFVFPSLSEGFGLPGLEAMMYGVPVLAAKASCLPEVYGDAAEYFDPTNRGDLTAKIDALTSNQARRDELVALGHAQISRYSWKAVAEQTLAAYKVAERGRKAN